MTAGGNDLRGKYVRKGTDYATWSALSWLLLAEKIVNERVNVNGVSQLGGTRRRRRPMFFRSSDTLLSCILYCVKVCPPQSDLLFFNICYGISTRVACM